MTAPDLLARYQHWRTRRHVARVQRYGHLLPSWRTRRRRRVLVVAIAVLLAAMAAVSAWALTSDLSPYLPWLVLVLAFLALWTTLQIVADRGDDPRAALDEYELALRDRARSIGFTVTQCAVFVPAVVLISVDRASTHRPIWPTAAACW